MLCKIGNRWIDYQQPIDLLDLLSYMEIGLCWYQNNNESIWTYDLTDHVMVELVNHHCISYNELYCKNKFIWVIPMVEQVFTNFVSDR